ncbi:MAG: RluA family pseudouridine synthase [Oscillospiraceae bacterium]
MRELLIGANDAGQRLDKFLAKAVDKLPQGLTYKYLRTKRIKLNGKRCEGAARLAEGDVISLYIGDEFFNVVAAEYAFLNAWAELNIVYEDAQILLADKPCGLVVHEDEENTADTLIARIQRYLFEKGAYDPAREQSFAPALCNRIDRNTSGLVLCAKTAEALRILNQKIRDREIEKRYLCVTAGVPAQREAELRAFHRKDERTKTAEVSDRPLPGFRTMVTRYKVLADDGVLALVEAELVTGRTHQIRAQFAWAGFPLLGDGKYGINRINRDYNVKTQLLHARRVKFCFSTDAGVLSYLDGQEFCTEMPWFAEKFFPHQKN